MRRRGSPRRSQLGPHDDVIVGLVADHEGMMSDRLEAVALVEAPGAMIVGEHRQIEGCRAAAAAFGDRPFDQRLSDAGPLPGLENVELAQLRRRFLALPRDGHRRYLRET